MKPLYGKVLVDGVTVGAPNYIKAGMIGEITYYQINKNTFVKFPQERSGQTSWCFATNQVEIFSPECPIVGGKMMELEIKNIFLENENKLLREETTQLNEEKANLTDELDMYREALRVVKDDRKQITMDLNKQIYDLRWKLQRIKEEIG